MNEKQRRFCIEYMVDLNAAAAARRAGYSAKSARTTGPRLLSNAVVLKFISQLKNSQSAAVEISTETVLEGLYGIATKGKVESARVRAYELLGKYKGLWLDRVESTGAVGQVVIMIPDNGRGDQPLQTGGDGADTK